MDGVLIDSEPFWQIAERKVYKDLYQIELTDKDIHTSTGLKTTEVVQMHCKNYNIKNYDVEKIGHEIEKSVIEQVKEQGKAKEGLYELVNFIKTMNLRRFLVTSSSHYVLNNIVSYLGLDDFFEHKFSAYDELLGKPDPAVYLSAIAYSKEAKEHILVIEDSMNGVTAAYRSGLKVLALPEESNRLNPKYLLAEKIVTSHLDVVDYLKVKNNIL